MRISQSQYIHIALQCKLAQTTGLREPNFCAREIFSLPTKVRRINASLKAILFVRSMNYAFWNVGNRAASASISTAQQIRLSVASSIVNHSLWRCNNTSNLTETRPPIHSAPTRLAVALAGVVVAK